jgi:hypothetical protein
MTVKLSLAVLWMSSIASASPAYELTELMTRAQTVALVTIDKRDAHGITVRAKTVYRGSAARHLQIDPAEVPDGEYVALSQGDKPFGPPTDDARLGQGTEGQRGYRGWLLYPVRHVHGHDVVDPTRLTARDGEVRIDTLGAVVAKHPYREAGE